MKQFKDRKDEKLGNISSKQNTDFSRGKKPQAKRQGRKLGVQGKTQA